MNRDDLVSDGMLLWKSPCFAIKSSPRSIPLALATATVSAIASLRSLRVSGLPTIDPTVLCNMVLTPLNAESSANLAHISLATLVEKRASIPAFLQAFRRPSHRDLRLPSHSPKTRRAGEPGAVITRG